MSQFIKHDKCDNCGSRDNLAVYDDHTYCFGCKDRKSNVEKFEKETLGIRYPLRDADYVPLADRKISESTARKYRVQFQPDEKVQHVYPYFDRDGHHCANKLRLQGPGKNFLCEGMVNQSGLFGQNLFPSGSAETITIVEGECDAMAAFEMQGSRYPVVSLRNGCEGATRDIVQNFEYLNGFNHIVICFDKDEAKVQKDGTVRYPGQEAALTIAALFPLKKVRILTLADAKDANDYLAKGWSAKFLNEWWKAPVYTPTGLKLGKDMWDEVSALPKYESIPYPWESLNKMTYGIRLSEVVLITGETGDGKTSIIKEIEHHILQTSTSGIGLLHLEEPNRDTLLGLLSITANKPLHLPDVRQGVTQEELRGYYDSTTNNDRVVVWDHFGSNSIHEVLAKIRHMSALGCKYIILDHLSIVVSDQAGDERKQLDEIATKLKTLCMELNIAVIAVIHLNREGLIRGSAGPEQLANLVFKIYRDKKDIDPWRRNVTKLVVDKNRFCGRTGPATYLFYDHLTGRLYELNQADIDLYELGLAGKKKEHW